MLSASRTFVRQREADMDDDSEHTKCEKNIKEAQPSTKKNVYANGNHDSDAHPCGKPGSVSIDDYKDGIWIALHCLMRPNT